jgi:hypothetical protein
MRIDLYLTERKKEGGVQELTFRDVTMPSDVPKSIEHLAGETLTPIGKLHTGKVPGAWLERDAGYIDLDFQLDGESIHSVNNVGIDSTLYKRLAAITPGEKYWHDFF